MAARIHTTQKYTPQARYMHLAIELARKNRKIGGEPVAALVVRNDRILAARATDLRSMCDPTAHAEINAIRAACRAERGRFLAGCVLYTTFEPCPMCTSTAIWAKMFGIVFGANQADRTKSAHQRIAIPAADIARRGTPHLEVYADFLRAECLTLIN